MNYARKFLYCITLIFSLSIAFFPSSTVFAISGEVTSDPGERVDPVTGLGTENHAGMDVAGMPEGEPVDSPVSGTVINAGDYEDGYGNSVVIAMDEGGIFRLGHNSAVDVSEGDHVSIGQIVAYAGSTGKSTGVHVHAEWRPLATGMDDSYTTPYGNPGPILLAAGWQLNGYTGNGVIHRVGQSLKDMFNKVVNVHLNLNFDYMFKLGSSIRTIVDSVVDGCIVAMKSLIQVSLPLLLVLAIIDFSMFAWRGPTITGQLDSAFWTGAAQRIVKYGFLALMIESWQLIVNKVFIGTAKWSYLTFSPDTASAIGDITAPDQQLQHFIAFLNPSMEWLSSLTVSEMFDHIGLFFLNMFISYSGLILFVILIFSILVIYLEFYLSAVFSVFGLAFAGLKPTSFIPEGMMSHLISGTIRLMSIGIVFTIMKKVMDTYSYIATDIMGLLGAFLFVIVIVVVGILLPNRIADGLQVSAKL